MKSVFLKMVPVVFGVAACMGFGGCGEMEFEVDEPDFEIGVEFDFHDMEFDYRGHKVTPVDEGPMIVPTFKPCYYKIVEAPSWITVDGDNGWSQCYDDEVMLWLWLKCERNNSVKPRNGEVKVLVSNTTLGWKDSGIDLPEYRFEGEFTVRQEGCEDLGQ